MSQSTSVVRATKALTVLLLSVVVPSLAATSSYAGDFKVIAMRDSYTLNSSAEDLDLAFDYISQMGAKYVQGHVDDSSTALASQYGLKMIAMNSQLQWHGPGKGTNAYKQNFIRVLDTSPHYFETLIDYGFYPNYEAASPGMSAQYTWDPSSRRGALHGAYWTLEAGIDSTGYGLTDFVHYTASNYLGTPLYKDASLAPVQVDACFYLSIADTSYTTDTLAIIEIFQNRGDSPICPSDTTIYKPLFVSDFTFEFNDQSPQFDSIVVPLTIEGGKYCLERYHLKLYWPGNRDLFVKEVQLKSHGVPGLLWTTPQSMFIDSIQAYYASLSPASVLTDLYSTDEIWGASMFTFRKAQDILDDAGVGSWPDVRMTTGHYNSNLDLILQGHSGANDTLKWQGMVDYFDPNHITIQTYSCPCYTDSASDGDWDSTNVQWQYDKIRNRLLYNKQLLERAGLPLIPKVQTGAWIYWNSSVGKYVPNLREISPNELKCLLNLIMCVNADGVAYNFYSGTACPIGDTVGNTGPRPDGLASLVDESATDICSQCDCYSYEPRNASGLVDFDSLLNDSCRNSWYRTPKWYVASDFNHWVDALSDVFDYCTWIASVDSDSIPSVASRPNVSLDSLESLTFEPLGKRPFVEAAFFTHSGSEYFMLLNRRALSDEGQTVRAWIDGTSGLYKITDMYTEDTVLTGSFSSGEIPFTTYLEPGEASLFKIESAGYSSVSGSSASYPSTWTGTIPVMGNFDVASGSPLTIQGPAEIRLESGGSYSIDVYDDFRTYGTSADSVFFVSSAGTPVAGDWYGIRHYSGDLDLNQTGLKYVYRGVSIMDTSGNSTASINQSSIEESQVSGVYVDCHENTHVAILDTWIKNWGYYGAQIAEGIATLDGCTFTGSGKYGVYFAGAWEAKPCRGKVWNCRFENLEYTNGYGVYLAGLRNGDYDPTYHWEADTLLKNNVYLIESGNGESNQTAYGFINCGDPIQAYMNAVWGSSITPFGDQVPSYGIINWSTRILLKGNTAAPESLSLIQPPLYGLYCLGLASDTQYAKVREMSLHAWMDEGGQGYSVWVNDVARLDLGTGSEYGYNAIYSCSPKCNVYAVYNDTSATSSIPVDAVGNYWYGSSGGPLFYGPVIASFPLPLSPWSGGNPLKVAIFSVSNGPAGVGELVLGDAYPNPFNASITIHYRLPTPQKVVIEVYNILGQRVATLWDGDQEAGEHHLQWDGRNRSGQAVSSGVYFYRIATQNKKMTKQMVLLK